MTEREETKQHIIGILSSLRDIEDAKVIKREGFAKLKQFGNENVSDGIGEQGNETLGAGINLTGYGYHEGAVANETEGYYPQTGNEATSLTFPTEDDVLDALQQYTRNKNHRRILEKFFIEADKHVTNTAGGEDIEGEEVGGNEEEVISEDDLRLLSKAVSNCKSRHYKIVRLLLRNCSRIDPTWGYTSPSLLPENMALEQARFMKKRKKQSKHGRRRTTESSSQAVNHKWAWKQDQNFLFLRTITWRSILFSSELLRNNLVLDSLNLDAVFELTSLYDEPFGVEFITVLLDLYSRSLAKTKKKTSNRLTARGVTELCERFPLALAHDFSCSSKLSLSESEESEIAAEVVINKVKTVFQHEAVWNVMEPKTHVLDALFQLAMSKNSLTLIEFFLSTFPEFLSDAVISIAISDFTTTRSAALGHSNKRGSSFTGRADRDSRVSSKPSSSYVSITRLRFTKPRLKYKTYPGGRASSMINFAFEFDASSVVKLHQEKEERAARFLQCFLGQEHLLKTYRLSNKVLYDFTKRGNVDLLELLLDSTYPWGKNTVRKCFDIAIEYKQPMVLELLYVKYNIVSEEELKEFKQVKYSHGRFRVTG